jgi:catecholate siderophore receptor
MKKSARKKDGVMVMGALVASAVVAPHFATPTIAAELPKPRYADAMAAVLRELRLSHNDPQGAATQVAQPRQFDIAPGSLGEALAEFEKQSGVAVTITQPGIKDIDTTGATGVLGPEQALQRLLAGTGLTYRFTGATAVTVDVPGQSEFVSVSGTASRLATSKFTTPMRDIPQTITVIKSDVIQAQGATTLRDALRNVSGITFQAGEGGGGLPGDSFTMRGFSAGNDLFVDGVRDTGGYTRDAFNLEQIEVVKGPSSSISGRGSTGGAVNQVTKSPTAIGSLYGSIGGGTDAYRRGTFDVNQPLGEASKGIAFRVNGMWTENDVPGRNVVENGSWGLAPSLAVGLGSPTTVMVKSQHLRQDNVPDYGLPWGTYPGFPTGAFNATPPVDQSNFYGLRDYDFEEIDSDAVTVDALHRFAGGLVARNVTRYVNTSRDSAITAPRPPNRQLQRRMMSNENLANQTSLTAFLGRGSLRHEIVSGIDLSRELTGNQNSAQAANQPAVDLLNPDPNQRPFGPMPANTGNPSNTRLNQVGVYAFDSAHLGSQWLVTGGLRWDVVDVDYDLTTLTTGAVTTIESSDSMVSWRAGVVYKPRANGSIYAGAGTSFNPSVDAAATGAAFSTSPTAANNPNLAPEETRNIELGSKWDVAEGRLSLTGAIFRTEKVNARTRNLTSDPFILAGRQRVAGVELGVSGSLTSRWTALGTYAFMDSEIEESANAAEEGQNMTLTPENTFSIWTTYQLPANFVVGGGAQFMDNVFRNTLNTLQVPSYWLINSLVSYAVNRNLTLRLNGTNLADIDYVDRVGGGHYIPGPRRQVMLNADVSF